MLPVSLYVLLDNGSGFSYRSGGRLPAVLARVAVCPAGCVSATRPGRTCVSKDQVCLATNTATATRVAGGWSGEEGQASSVAGWTLAPVGWRSRTTGRGREDGLVGPEPAVGRRIIGVMDRCPKHGAAGRMPWPELGELAGSFRRAGCLFVRASVHVSVCRT